MNKNFQMKGLVVVVLGLILSKSPMHGAILGVK